MTAYIALLRAVNVGGTGKLPTPTLVKMYEACGFEEARTCIASTNRTVATFLDQAPPARALDEVVIPAAQTGTARNMHTIAKLAAMAVAS